MKIRDVIETVEWLEPQKMRLYKAPVGADDCGPLDASLYVRAEPKDLEVAGYVLRSVSEARVSTVRDNALADLKSRLAEVVPAPPQGEPVGWVAISSSNGQPLWMPSSDYRHDMQATLYRDNDNPHDPVTFKPVYLQTPPPSLCPSCASAPAQETVPGLVQYNAAIAERDAAQARVRDAEDLIAYLRIEVGGVKSERDAALASQRKAEKERDEYKAELRETCTRLTVAVSAQCKAEKERIEADRGRAQWIETAQYQARRRTEVEKERDAMRAVVEAARKCAGCNGCSKASCPMHAASPAADPATVQPSPTDDGTDWKGTASAFRKLADACEPAAQRTCESRCAAFDPSKCKVLTFDGCTQFKPLPAPEKQYGNAPSQPPSAVEAVGLDSQGPGFTDREYQWREAMRLLNLATGLSSENALLQSVVIVVEKLAAMEASLAPPHPDPRDQEVEQPPKPSPCAGCYWDKSRIDPAPCSDCHGEHYTTTVPRDVPHMVQPPPQRTCETCWRVVCVRRNLHTGACGDWVDKPLTLADIMPLPA
ncbi:MAG: hypothetical protein WC683_02095, partial [bacterium]